MPTFPAHGAMKAAARPLARTGTMGPEDRKIRVNALSPGPIDTPGVDGLVRSEEEARQFKAGIASQIPLGRLGDSDEIAKAAVFLASDDSSFVTGVELFVDGGMAQV